MAREIGGGSVPNSNCVPAKPEQSRHRGVGVKESEDRDIIAQQTYTLSGIDTNELV